MSNLILEKYRSLKPINDEQVVHAMLAVLIDIPNDKQEDFWIRGVSVGNVRLYMNDRFPGKVLEYVQGSKDDSVTTLYEMNPIFASRAALSEARADLINEIGRVLLAIPSTVEVHDVGRERRAVLKELGTAQLQDVLAHFVSADVATV